MVASQQMPRRAEGRGWGHRIKQGRIASQPFRQRGVRPLRELNSFCAMRTSFRFARTSPTKNLWIFFREESAAQKELLDLCTHAAREVCRPLEFPQSVMPHRQREKPVVPLPPFLAFALLA
jgi:hypothetical protein